jgi:hypothetical protein
MQKILVALFIVLTAAAGIFVLADRLAMQERAADRRALEARGSELAARALGASSPLACLDGIAGDAVENTCERALFGRPETVAAAVAYTSARLDLLSDAADLARKSDSGVGKILAGLRRAVELDRFGVAAHVLATRDGCTVDSCAAFTWVSNSATLKSNMRGRVYSQYVDRYSASWSEPETPAAAAAPQAQGAQPQAATPPVAALGPPTRPVPSARYDFPSAASIPPVSIMNPEPKGPPVPAPPSSPAAAAR